MSRDDKLRTSAERRAGCAFLLVAALAATGCGRAGPPLPPLVKLPNAPAEFVAERRGGRVDLQFGVPAVNTDNTRPANVSRVEVFAITSRDPVTVDQVIKHGTRVATVAVKAPRDPNETIDEDESPADMEPPEGHGLDQGAVARVSEALGQTTLVPVDVPKDKKDANASEAARIDGPLLPALATPLSRTYVAVGVTTRDRKGAASRAALVPLVPPPPPPRTPAVTYDESAIQVVWEPVPGAVPIQREPTGDELPSKPIGPRAMAIAYNVYDAVNRESPARLTSAPLEETKFSDSRIAWGEERCYSVRTVETIGDLTIESDAPPPKCVTLTDKFAPAPPAHLQSSPSEGAVNLIWDPNPEKDLAGYIVLRGPSVDLLQPITDTPIEQPTYRDEVPAGVRYVYAIKAVDKAGNASAISNTVEEAAR